MKNLIIAFMITRALLAPISSSAQQEEQIDTIKILGRTGIIIIDRTNMSSETLDSIKKMIPKKLMK